MHHLIEISLGQLLLQPPLVCFCCRVFLTMLEKGRWLPHRQKILPFFTTLFICPVFCVDYEYAVGLCHTCCAIVCIFDLCTRGGRVPRHSCLVFYIINRIIKKWYFLFFFSTDYIPSVYPSKSVRILYWPLPSGFVFTHYWG